MEARDEDGLATRLGRALREAIAARDQVAMSALRSALGAIGNAEAVDPGTVAGPVAGPAVAGRAASPHFAGTVAGLGAAEAGRRVLSEADVARIVRAEIAERRDAAREYEQAGRADQSERLTREADVLLAVLSV